MGSPSDLENIPKGLFTGRPATHWTWDYERDDWLKIADRSPFNETDVLYEFNRWGYRGAPLDERSPYNILAIGCSCTFGAALPYDLVFHQVLKRSIEERLNLPVTVWNLGIPGASNDLLIRLLLESLPVLKPSLVIMSFTYLSRRELHSENGARFDYFPNKSPSWHKDFYALWEAQLRLASEFDDTRNFSQSVNAAAALLRKQRWIITGAHHQVTDALKGNEHAAKFAGSLGTWDSSEPHSKARDLLHPGAGDHRALADSCFALLSDLDYLSA